MSTVFHKERCKRKSPRILSYFFGALLFAVILALAAIRCYRPAAILWTHFTKRSLLLAAVQIVLIALVGTLCCCLLFFPPGQARRAIQLCRTCRSGHDVLHCRTGT